MTTLMDRIPDVEVLLALPDQELALTMLQLCDEHKRNGTLFHPKQIADLARPQMGGDGPEYPAARRQEVDLAVGEAWNWLAVQGLLITESGNGGWARISRRGRKLLDEGTFHDYARGVAFPKALLHPAIAEDVWLDLARGDFGSAVFKAFRAVEIAVRQVGKFTEADIGVPLMRKAFGQGAPLADADRLPAETDALSNLFAGAIGSYKNPHSHRKVDLVDLTEAQEMVMLASHLLRIVDSRR